MNSDQTFISQIYRVVGPLGEKLDLFSPLRFKTKSYFGYKTSKIKSQSELHNDACKARVRFIVDSSIFLFSTELHNDACKARVRFIVDSSIFLFSTESFKSDF